MNTADSSAEQQVIVVGAGPAGLALALELGLRGIRVRVIEKQVRAGAQPRAKNTNVRTMQHMRRWKVARKLREAAPLAPDYPSDVVFSTTLFGRTLATIENAFEGRKCRDERFPEAAQWVPQYTVEAVLRDRLTTLPNVTLTFGTTLEDVSQSADGVTATIGDTVTGDTKRLRAAFLVGADGARSRVRDAIGAKMQGDHAFAFNYNLILRIPELETSPPAQRAIMYWLVNPASSGVMGPIDSGALWYFNTNLPPGVREVADEEIVQRVHAAVDRPVAVEIVNRDTWAAHRRIADHDRDRRIFLAGDACHLHPPFGGYGMNLGIADGVDLGWKLAAVLEGWGGDGLLASYEEERRPVHQRTVAEAIKNYSVLSSHLLTENLDEDTAGGESARAAVAREIMATKTREFHTLGVVLGSHYEGSPIIAGDGSAPPLEHYSAFEPSAHPGCLAPHAWLDDGSSLYDHLGPDYTLLCLDDRAAASAQAIADAAAAAGMPLRLLAIRNARVSTLCGAPLVLVRPDQHVAWRGNGTDPGALVDTVRGAPSATARGVVSSEITRKAS